MEDILDILMMTINMARSWDYNLQPHSSAVLDCQTEFIGHDSRVSEDQ